MKILVSWLREFVAAGADPRDLADVLTMRGFEVSDIAAAPGGAADDAVLDLEITTNRPDCLSVRGVAREVSTIYGLPLLDGADWDGGQWDGNGGDISLPIAIESPDLCPRYAAAVDDVTIGPSPAWLAARLEAAGMRPINNVVDATNYVMLELGQPLHAFDLARLAGPALRIRRAAPGESIRTLDGRDHELDQRILVIADAERPQALAGVMGGAASEVSAATRTVVLESACFEPVSVRRTSKRTALSTDASFRFERGTDIETPVAALERLRGLLSVIAGGRARGPIADCYPAPRRAAVITLRHARVGRVLGIDIDPAFIPLTLRRLGFGVDAAGGGDVWTVTVPTHRVDVSREVDLIEEIARHYGYDRLPSTFPAVERPAAQPGGWLRRNRLLTRQLTASGCSEAFTYTFIERAAAEPFAAGAADIVPLANPLSEKFTVLRPSLLPGLVDAAVHNRRHGHHDVRLFEIGKRFSRGGGEVSALGIVVTGAGGPPHWSSATREADLFDVTGIVERVCEALGVAAAFESAGTDGGAPFVAGRTAVVHGRSHDGRAAAIGRAGQIDPALATGRGFPAAGGALLAAELDLQALDGLATDRRALHAAPLPRHPSIVRDLAVVVDAALSARAVRDTIRAAAAQALVGVREFDRYAGKEIPDGRVSLAFHLTFRAPDRTLTDAEVTRTMAVIVARLTAEHGAALRKEGSESDG